MYPLTVIFHLDSLQIYFGVFPLSFLFSGFITSFTLLNKSQVVDWDIMPLWQQACVSCPKQLDNRSLKRGCPGGSSASLSLCLLFLIQHLKIRSNAKHVQVYLQFHWGFPHGSGGKETICSVGFNPCVGKILWRREWLCTPVFLSGESHRQRSLVCYSPRDRKRLRHD